MEFSVSTQGHYDFVNVTDRVAKAVRDSGVADGIAVVFAIGTTVGLMLMEDEEGVKKDLVRLWEVWAPEHADYEHHKKWHDHNGAAHLKSALQGVSLSLPVAGGKLQLGQWQSVMIVDFDERPRERNVMVTVLPTTNHP